MTDENKNNTINGHYKHEKNSWRTGGEFHVTSESYPWLCLVGLHFRSILILIETGNLRG